MSQKHFVNDPCMEHPSRWKSGFSLIETVSSDLYKNTFLSETKNLFNMNSWIILSEKGSDFVELFGFVSEKRNCLEDIYLNHSHLLKSFAAHFKKAMHPLICQMQAAAISLSALKDGIFNSNQPNHPMLEKEVLYAYLKDLGMKSKVERATSLSVREVQCLKLILSGKSAREMAADLILSTRTIEFYLENIKNKLNCINKRELFSVADDFVNLGLL